MNIDTYYYFLDLAGISPLCKTLLQTDRYPTLRLILTFEKVMCGEDEEFNYQTNDKFDENRFENDVVQVFPDLIRKLKVRPEMAEQFWNIFHLIVRKYYQFVKSTDYFRAQDKLDFFRGQYRAVKTGTFITAASSEANFIALNSFLKDVIAELEEENAASPEMKTNSTGSTLTNEKNIQSGVNASKTGIGTSKPPKTNTGPKYLPIEKLFTDEQMIGPMINYLKRDKIRILDDNGHWLGLTRRKTELMGFIKALHKRTLINFTTSLEVGLAFREKFYISISTRSFTIPTHIREDMVNSYLRIIDAFLAEYNTQKPTGHPDRFAEGTK
jgi:hypothetical protein